MEGRNLYIVWQPPADTDTDSDTSSHVTGYRIEYRTVGRWGVLVEVAGTATWYNWTTASYSAKYRFHIFALGYNGLTSEPSDEIHYETKGGRMFVCVDRDKYM